MINRIVNGKRKKFKLPFERGKISFKNYKKVGFKIFPDEETLRRYFDKKKLLEFTKNHYSVKQLEFESNYWVEKRVYRSVVPVIEEIGFSDFRDSILALMQHAVVMYKPAATLATDEYEKEKQQIRQFFKNLSSRNFKIEGVLIKSSINRNKRNLSLTHSYWINGLKKHLLKWKKSKEFGYLVWKGPDFSVNGLKSKALNYRIQDVMFSDVVDFIYNFGQAKSLRDAIKKSLALFNSIDLKPPEKKSVKSVRKSEDYRTMEGLMIQRLEQRIKRAMKKMRQQAR